MPKLPLESLMLDTLDLSLARGMPSLQCGLIIKRPLHSTANYHCARPRGHVGPHVHVNDEWDPLGRWVCGMIKPLSHSVVEEYIGVKSYKPEADLSLYVEAWHWEYWMRQCRCRGFDCIVCNPEFYGLAVAES